MALPVEMDRCGGRDQCFVFLAMNDFAKDGGGTLRIYGILNALADDGCSVTLISNALHTGRFHPAIKHIAIGRTVSRRQKALLQGMIAWLPDSIVSLIYHRLLGRLKDSLAQCPWTDTLYSFEYLDNSLAYLLRNRGEILHYVNDTHGMAVLEFEAQFKTAATIPQKIKFWFKSLSAERLDRNVFSSASGVIYGSHEMRRYYEQNFIKNEDEKPDSIVVPFVFSGDPGNRPNPDLEKRLRRDYDIGRNDFLFLFAGSYKATSGVDNLIEAFGRVHAKAPHTKLMLIGRTGPLWESCMEKVRRSNFGNAVIFIDSIPYNELVTYQQLASAIVCPDRANSFSEYIVHAKYYDALWSGKPVISGGFASMRTINPDDMLSLSFVPGDTEDLCRAMEYSLAHYAELFVKYGHNREHVMNHYTYRSFVGCFVEWDNKLKTKWG